MKYTSNYNLPQYEGRDKEQRKVFNDAMKLIDAGIIARGNCNVVAGTYTGDGNYDKTPTLTFSTKPLLLFVHGGGYSILMPYGSGTWSFAHSRGSSMPIGATWEGTPCTGTMTVSSTPQSNF
nr:MAG TPA: kynurenine formamidase [Bacteriophage sp.]